jgi:hypothetical protein
MEASHSSRCSEATYSASISRMTSAGQLDRDRTRKTSRVGGQVSALLTRVSTCRGQQGLARPSKACRVISVQPKQWAPPDGSASFSLFESLRACVHKASFAVCVTWRRAGRSVQNTLLGGPTKRGRETDPEFWIPNRRAVRQRWMQMDAPFTRSAARLRQTRSSDCLLSVTLVGGVSIMRPI